MKNKKQQAPLLTPKRAGVCLHVTSLPGRYGIGGPGQAARAFIRTLKKMQATVWQVLPTGPTGYGNSPYQALSLFAGNELLIDVDTLIKESLVSRRDAERLTGAGAKRVDFNRLIPAKTALLSVVAERFDARASADMRAGFDDFLHDVDARWLHDYACYRVLKTRYRERPWTEWERHHRRRYRQSLAKLVRDAGNDIRHIKILQYLYFRQWRALKAFAADEGVLLFGDMPIYMATDSADAWTRPDLLQVDRDGQPTSVAGVPPDYFDPDGQRWGNPLYRWTRHRREEFAWWIDRIEHAAAQADLVRIDHFRGFESYWSVPADAPTAREGHWVKAPGDALFQAIEARLGHLPIIAEDLGDITPAVTRLRKRFGIPGMLVLQFAVADDSFDPANIEADCVCYTGTHDNDTTAGWFAGSGQDSRTPDEVLALQEKVLAITGGSAATVHHDLLHIALQSAAGLVIAPMQDILGLGTDARLNTPGTDRGNWRWRLTENQLDAKLCDRIAEMIAASGRAARQLPQGGA